jgi:AcrR family transcriptional regulator
MDPIAARRLEEKQRRRLEILEAALKVAARSGIEGLTMEHVAREARLSRGLLYVYFRDRTDLHYGLCEQALGLIHERLAAAAAATPRGADQLIAMGRAYVEFSRDCPVYFEALVRFQASEATVGAGAGHLLGCLQAGARVHELMTGAIETGIGDGSVSVGIGEVNTVAITLWALMHGAIQIARLKGAVLAQHGVSAQALVEQTLRMASVALARS